MRNLIFQIYRHAAKEVLDFMKYGTVPIWAPLELVSPFKA